MARRPKNAIGTALVTSRGIVGNLADVPVLQELHVNLTPLEEKFARLFVLYSNATKAYVEAAAYTGPRHIARTLAWGASNRPHILRRIREYESAAAAAVVIDYAAILDHDRQVIEGYRHIDKAIQYIRQCCRYCHGVSHAYQWVDFNEYLESLGTAEDRNSQRRELGKSEAPLPTDEGGYGFDPQAEPNFMCVKCEGRGHAITVIADTTKLEGPVRAAIVGVKETRNGTELVLHDIDKAKERVLRSGGYLRSDASEVGRAAAFGAAVGASAGRAKQAAEDVTQMTAEEAQKLYLELV
jgi:phage terminase small subunit